MLYLRFSKVNRNRMAAHSATVYEASLDFRHTLGPTSHATQPMHENTHNIHLLYRIGINYREEGVPLAPYMMVT